MNKILARCIFGFSILLTVIFFFPVLAANVMGLATMSGGNFSWREMIGIAYFVGVVGLFPMWTLVCYVCSKKHYANAGKYPLYILLPLIGIAPMLLMFFLY